MKLYTRSGDDGTTGLFSGIRVSKDHPRIEAYGTVDECNAILGLCVAACSKTVGNVAIRDILLQAQNHLFDLGADLATPDGAKNQDRIARITELHVADAEGWIDLIEAKNKPLSTFILPGGTELAARLHQARTVCRRAERLLVVLKKSESIGDPVLKYMNRLSDLLFAMARLSNEEAGLGDTPWRTSKKG